MLHRWVDASGKLTARAKAILASETGQSVISITHQTGLSRCAVFAWRKRFRQAGLRGIAPKAILELPDAERRELERWQAEGGLRALRATVILEFAETFDIAGAARKAGVHLNVARHWRTVFSAGGTSTLRPATNVGRPLLRELSTAERLTLAAWADAQTPLATKAKCLLGVADGQSVSSLAADFGLPASKIQYWCRRFVAGGIRAFAPDETPLFTPTEQTDLERLVNRGQPKVAARAKTLLQAAQRQTLERAANNMPTPASPVIKRWIRAYKRRGTAGLDYSHERSGKDISKAGPLNLNLRMDAQLRLECPPLESITLRGKTVTISNQCVKIALSEPIDPKTLHGRNVFGTIAWPVLRDGKEPVVLAMRGFVAEAAPGTITVKLRLATFERPEAAAGLNS